MNLQDVITTVEFPFRKERELYRLFHSILGFYPKDIRPYKQALLHKSSSVVGEQGRKLNNERLEFLGDAILDAVVADIVYRHFEKKPEGFLTNTRSKIVQRETLNKIAQEMGLDKLIKSDGHLQNAHNSYVGGNAFEALVGAIYMDRGYECCVRFVKSRILQRLIDIDKIAYKEINFKSKLIEWSQKNRIEIEFQLVEEGKEEGHTPTFLTHVVIEGIVCGKGKGYSKKESQQCAAKDALARLKRHNGLEEEVFDAKGKRTATEETPMAPLPNIPEEVLNDNKRKKRKKNTAMAEETSDEAADDETATIDATLPTPETPKQKSREEIIAEAEELAQSEIDI